MFDYNFHVGDFKTSTGHLTDAEELAYRRLLDMYYSTENPISLNLQQVARKIKSTTAIVEQLMTDFFKMEPDGYHNKRCDVEIELYRQRCEKNSKAGKESAKKRAEQKVIARQQDCNDRSTPVEHPLSECQPYQLPSSPVPTSPVPESNTPPSPPTGGERRKRDDEYDDKNFLKIWGDYVMVEGRGRGSKKKAWVEWKRLSLRSQQLAFYLLPMYIALTEKDDGGRYRKQVYLYIKDRLWEQFDVPDEIKEKIKE